MSEPELDFLRGLRWRRSEWRAQPALINASGWRISVYIGQRFDPKYFALVPDGWDYDVCHLCSSFLSEDESTWTWGFVAGNLWLCPDCFSASIEPHWQPGVGAELSLLRKRRFQSQDGWVTITSPMIIANGDVH